MIQSINMLFSILLLSCSSPQSQPYVTDYYVCGVTSIVIEAGGAGENETYKWYSSATGGTPLFTGNKYQLNVSETSSYWVAISFENGTESERVKSDVSVIPIPSSPVVQNAQRQGTGMVALKVEPQSGVDSYSWYSSASGGTPIFTGSTYQVNVTKTTSYWVDATSNEGCVSMRTQATATVLSNQ